MKRHFKMKNGASNYDGLIFSKARQCHRDPQAMDPMELDKQLKIRTVAMWSLWLAFKGFKPIAHKTSTQCMSCYATIDWHTVGIYSHIRERSLSPGDKWNPANVQILCPGCHDAQEHTEKDIRPDDFVTWCKKEGFFK